LEDVLFYKENDVSRLTEIEKFNIFQTVFNNKNFTLPFTNAYANYNNNTSSNNVIGLPLINKDITELTKQIELLPYKVDVILCKNFNDNNEKSEKIKYIKNTETQINKESFTNVENDEKPYKVNISDIINKVPSKKPPSYVESKTSYNSNKPTYNTAKPSYNSTKPSYNKEHVFIVKPNIQNDIYNLYMLTHDSKTEKFYDTAYIPNYTTSVMMNKLFRNIKENDNLDRLEESDDEDEFENENIDKFVYLEKTHAMICKYNYKFKKWYPVSLANKEAKIVNSTELQNK
jgi:hypothetical protein